MLGILRVYLSKNPFKSGSTELEVVTSASLKGARERLIQRKYRSKERKLCDWLSL